VRQNNELLEGSGIAWTEPKKNPAVVEKVVVGKKDVGRGGREMKVFRIRRGIGVGSLDRRLN